MTRTLGFTFAALVVYGVLTAHFGAAIIAALVGVFFVKGSQQLPK